jgi:hypothetical protein
VPLRPFWLPCKLNLFNACHANRVSFISAATQDTQCEMSAMKSPRNLAEGLKNSTPDKFLRESFRLPRWEARKRAKQLFEQYPSAAYMTEIETWHEEWGVVHFETKRLNEPIESLD